MIVSYLDNVGSQMTGIQRWGSLCYFGISDHQCPLMPLMEQNAANRVRTGTNRERVLGARI